MNKVCKCCKMAMTDAVYGKNGDGSVNTEYCRYCCSGILQDKNNRREEK